MYYLAIMEESVCAGNNMEGPCSPLTKEGTIHDLKKKRNFTTFMMSTQANCPSLLILLLKSLHMEEFYLAFVFAALKCFDWQCFSKSFSGPYRHVYFINTAPPEGSKITRIESLSVFILWIFWWHSGLQIVKHHWNSTKPPASCLVKVQVFWEFTFFREGTRKWNILNPYFSTLPNFHR